jgi:DNA-binding CsgD family transcriptional regulator
MGEKSYHPAQRPPRETAPVKERREKILALLTSGKTFEEIAHEMSMPYPLVVQDAYFARKAAGQLMGAYDTLPTKLELADYSTPQQEARRVRVAELLVRRKTYAEIAEILNCSHMTISNDVKVLRKVWGNQLLRDKDDLIISELMYIDGLERHTLEGFFSLPPVDQPATLRGLLALMERRQHLLGLTSTDKRDEANGILDMAPIQVVVNVVRQDQAALPPGSDNDDGNDDDGDIIDIESDDE